MLGTTVGLAEKRWHAASSRSQNLAGAVMPEFEEGIDVAKLDANRGNMRLDGVELYLSRPPPRPDAAAAPGTDA